MYKTIRILHEHLQILIEALSNHRQFIRVVQKPDNLSLRAAGRWGKVDKQLRCAAVIHAIRKVKPAHLIRVVYNFVVYFDILSKFSVYIIF